MTSRRITYLDLNNPILKKEQKNTVNLGALYIISALRKANIEVDYRDYQTSEYREDLKIESITNFAKESENVILMCCMAYMLPLVTLAIQKIKEEYPEKIIIMGGAGPTGVASKLIREFDGIDLIIKGEGEETVVEVLDKLNDDMTGFKGNLDEVDGIVTRDKDNNVLETKNRHRKKVLDEIDFPAYDYIDMKKYEVFGLVTGRGCAYRCKFCDIHGLWGNKYYQRSLDNVFEELDILVNKYGVSNISIWDDTFTVDRNRVVEFCNKVIENKLKFEWSCFSRVNLVDEEILKLMSKAGCKGIFFGLESGSEKVLDKIDKKITVEAMIKAIDLTKRFMEAKAHLIWGFPMEDREDLYKSFYLLNYLRNDIEVNISQLWPYPTSQIYREYKDKIRFNEELGSIDKILNFKEDEWVDRLKVIESVKEHKDIFTQFYYFHTDEFMHKYDLVKKMELIFS